MTADSGSENLYPTDLSDKFEAVGGSEYHILHAINEVRDALSPDDALIAKMNWIVTQLGNLAYTAGVEAGGSDIDAIVDARIADRDYNDALYRSFH